MEVYLSVLQEGTGVLEPGLLHFNCTLFKISCKPVIRCSTNETQKSAWEACGDLQLLNETKFAGP